MKYDSSEDDSSVLKNKLGIIDPAELEMVEADYYLIREVDCLETVGSFQPNLDYLKRIHRHLFQDVYEWAGDVRAVDISKGDTRFANCNHIESSSHKLFMEMAAENFIGLSKEEFVRRAAFIMVS